MLAVQINLSYTTSTNLCGAKYGGTYTADGIKAIAESISVSASVTECNVRGNGLKADSAKELAKIATEKRVTLFGIHHGQTEADFRNQGIGYVDAILIANDLAVTASITSVRLVQKH